MNWENLKNFECPNCGQTMELETGEYRCTACHFHIEEGRANSIRTHRSGSGPEVKMKWQNLRDQRCPICGDEIKLADRRQIEAYYCQTSGCRFRIRKSSFEAILADPTHSANKFYSNELRRNEGL